jgi:hypothetical protein
MVIQIGIEPLASSATSFEARPVERALVKQTRAFTELSL